MFAPLAQLAEQGPFKPKVWSSSLQGSTIVGIMTNLTFGLIILSYIFILHFIGDFGLQSRWMAENKSKNYKALLAHGLVYTLFLSFMMGLPFGYAGILYGLFNGVIHTMIDAISSRLSSAAWRSGKIGRFWKIIGADQCIHQVVLIMSMGVFLI